MQSDDSESIIADMLSAIGDVAKGNLRRRVPTPGNAHANLNALAQGMNQVIEAWRASELESRKMRKVLEAKVATIETQTVALRELSTPVLDISPGVLLVPIIGALHERRSAEMMTSLLDRIMQTESTQVIVDISGVEVVDTATADMLLRLVRAAKLLGARCVLTGVSPAVARTLVALGTDLGGLGTRRTLADGLAECMRHIHENELTFSNDRLRSPSEESAV